MIDRLTVLVGAGVITVGVAGGLLAGAGAAAATTEPAAGSATTASESAVSETTVSESTVSQPTASEGKRRSGSARDAAPDAGESAEPDDTTDNTDTETDSDAGTENDTEAEPEADDEAVAVELDVDEPVSTDIEAIGAEPEVEAAEPVPAAATPADWTPAAVDIAAPASERAPEPAAVVEPLVTLKPVAASPIQQATSPARQTLLSLIGTAIFNIYSLAIRVLGGPPILPRDSTVTVRSSTVRIDCGQGYDVPADWYVPEGPTPTRLIHFQHGFLASGAFYSYTAARLAEATHSIVVATSMTSNFLACDGCWVGGSPMHKAVADLFADGNTALAQSALAAGYSSTLLDGVQKVALVGHSAGGGLAAGAAGYMTQNGTFGKLSGVVMLDGVGFGDVTPDALAKLPQDFPIYNLGARAYYWNLSGTTNTVMNEWRPGGFNGVKLARGSHGDTMTGGNPLIQVAMNLVTGWPRPENVKAAEMISAAWLNDMFSQTPPAPASGFYGAPGDTLQIETDRGIATAQVLPGTTERQTILDWLFTFGAKILFGIDFATCTVDADPEWAAFAELASPNTALSLDGRAKPGQSIAQQCVYG